MKKQKLPKWFKGSLYTEGLIVENPFSGEEYELTNVELSMYDFIIGSQRVFEVAPKTVTTKQVNDFHKALTWFRKNNSEAYMVLLD
jgi:hypothetical protein|tara:strand:+ start:86 stop:343 length:258 start_codon:yes stop_codon:yes gene_type:complete